MKEGEKNEQGSFTYLGYKLRWLRSVCESGTKLSTQFAMSKEKNQRIRDRIDAAFVHFTEKTKYSLSGARKDLKDSLRFIAGNFRLTKSKSGIKAGIYYSNDLLTDTNALAGLTEYLHSKTRNISVYPEVLKGMPERQIYVESIKRMVFRFDFQKNWKAHKSFSLSDKRIREISQWL